MRVPSSFRDLAIAGLVVAGVAAIQAAGSIVPVSRVYGTGSNAFGELGRGSFSNNESSASPVKIPFRLTMLDGGANASAGISESGQVFTWGRNTSMLGYSTSINQSTPRFVPNLPSSPQVAVSVSMGADHTLAAFSTGTVYSWGSNTSNQLGRSGAETPASVPGLSNVTQVSAGSQFSLARTAGGDVYAWGLNTNNQLGPTSGTGLRQLTTLPDIIAISAGTSHALALTSTGEVYAWGSSSFGQAGASSGNVVSPAPIAGLSNVIAIAAGDNFSLALRNDGTVWAWGFGGRLSPSGPSTSVPQPVAFSNNGSPKPMADIVAITAGSNFALALRTDGLWYGWGANAHGQLGLGFHSEPVSLAVLAPAAGAPITHIGAGGSHALLSVEDPPINGSFNVSPSVMCNTTMTTTLSLGGLSVTGLGKADVMLTLDESDSIAPADFATLKQFAQNFVNAQDVSPMATRVGIVMFDTDARLILPPTSDATMILNAIDAIKQGAQRTCIGCGLNKSSDALAADPRPDASRVIVVVTDGVNNEPQPNPQLALANAIALAKAANTVVSVGIGPDVNVDELTAIASSIPNVQTMFTTPNFASLDSLIDQLAAALTSPGAHDVTVTLDVAAGWQLLSASSPAGTVTRAGNHVEWTMPQLDHNGAGLTLSVRAVAGGAQALLLDAAYADAEGHGAQFSNPSIDVPGCLATIDLAPGSSSGLVGENHTVTATVKDHFGVPLGGHSLQIAVMSGPHAGNLGSSGLTNASGQLSRSYTGSIAGTDVIEAFLASTATVRSNAVTRTWLPPNAPPVANAGLDQTVLLADAPTAAVTLNGSASTDDGERQPLTYAWASPTGGPATGQIAVVDLARGLHTFTLSVFDGEMTHTDTVTINVADPDPPVVVSTVTGTQGEFGWYVSDVSVSFAISDPESGIASSTGCDPVTLTADTPQTTLVCRATNNAGPWTEVPVTIKRDATPPVLTTPQNFAVAATSTAGAVVSYADPTAGDSLSGLAGAASCLPASGTPFVMGVTAVVCSATDVAGNTGTATFMVTVEDTSPPQIDAAITGTAGNHEWFRSPVQVAWTVSDAQSSFTSTGCDPVTLPSDTTGVEITCSATSAGGTNSVTKTVMIDQAAPLFVPAQDVDASTADPGGVSVTFPTPVDTDTTSGIQMVSCAPASGSNFLIGSTDVTCSATDRAGNQAVTGFRVHVRLLDSTPPVIVPSVTGTEGASGWYRGPVTVSFAVSDGESAIASSSGCDAVTLSGNTPGQAFTCSATSEGGSNSASVTIKIDQDGPALVTPSNIVTDSTDPGGASVTYSATATDSPSGLAGDLICAPSSGSNFAIGITPVSCTATDHAGNTSTAGFTVTVQLLDSTPPSIVPSVIGTLGADGWYRTNVAISFAVTDGESAVTSNGCDAVTVSSDTTGQTFTCAAASEGGTSIQSVTVKRDATAPVLTTSPNISVVATGDSGAAVAYAPASATDATSGVAGSATCSPVSGTTFPTGTSTVSCTATDVAGNTASKSFTVTVTAEGGSNEPGRIHGQGHVMADNHRVQFDFSVLENARRGEQAKVDLRVRRGRNGRWDDDRFDSKVVTAVTFSNAPTYTPGKNPKSGIDTVMFSGTGKWDRQDGYLYVVTASDRGEPGRGVDTFTIEVRTPGGQVVLSGGGTIVDGNVQSNRVRRK